MTEINSDVKRTALYYGITQSQIAEALGVSKATMTRILSKPLTDMKKAEIMNIIDVLRLRHGK